MEKCLRFVFQMHQCGTTFDSKCIQKPTAEMYYDKMIQSLKMVDLSWKQLKAKMVYFRTKFVEMKTWLEGTGQGVDFGTIEDLKRKKCPFYDELYDIFASKANVTIPYHFDSLQESESLAIPQTTLENVDDEATVENVQECDNSGTLEDIDSQTSSQSGSIMIDLDNFLSPNASTNNSSFNFEIIGPEEGNGLKEISGVQFDDDVTNLPQEKTAEQLDDELMNPLDEETEEQTEQNANGLQKESDENGNLQIGTRLARFKHQLSQRPSGNSKSTKKLPSNAAAFISDSHAQRVEALNDRNKIELQRVQNEKLQIQLQRDRLKFEERVFNDQLDKDTNIAKEEIKSKDKDTQAKFDLKKQRFDYKMKKLQLKEKEKEDEFQLKVKEMEKAERLEAKKMELEYKLKFDLEMAKLTN